MIYQYRISSRIIIREAIYLGGFHVSGYRPSPPRVCNPILSELPSTKIYCNIYNVYCFLHGMFGRTTLDFIPITYNVMCDDIEPGEKINVSTRLYCHIRNGIVHSEKYNLIATVTRIFRAYDGACIEFEMDAEHPLLLDERQRESLECCTFELEVYEGEEFEIDIPISCPDAITDTSPLHNKRKRHKKCFTRAVNDVYHEALLDNEIAARVLTAAPGITTRNKFYPMKTK